LVCYVADIVRGGVVNLCEALYYKRYKAGVVALATMRHRSHIMGVGLEHYALKGNCGSECLGKVALLERENTTDAQAETLEGKEFLSLVRIAREAMEHSTMELALILAENPDHLILSLATVNHQGQTEFYSALHLTLEGKELFTLKLARPVEIEAYFADGDGRAKRWLGSKLTLAKRWLYSFADGGELVLPIGFHILRMETKHTIAVARILLAEATDGLYGTGVDGWNEQLDRSSIFATLDNEVEVFAEFLAIKVSMSVYVVQGFKSLCWFKGFKRAEVLVQEPLYFVLSPFVLCT
jgi:hypothetical protein